MWMIATHESEKIKISIINRNPKEAQIIFLKRGPVNQLQRKIERSGNFIFHN
jgi:hypothetical protein